jgi:hypothetical protein
MTERNHIRLPGEELQWILSRLNPAHADSPINAPLRLIEPKVAVLSIKIDSVIDRRSD